MIKLNLHRLFLLIGITLILASCSREVLPGGSPGDDSGDDDITGNYFSLMMSVPLPKGYIATRAPGDDAESLAEILVDGIRIVLYSKTDNKAKYCWDLDIQLGPDASDALKGTGSDIHSWEISGESVLIKAQAQGAYPGDYQMLIIVNPTVAVKAITGIDSPMSAITDGTFDPLTANALYRTANGVRGIPNDSPAYFLMLNHQGLISLNSSNFFATKGAAEANPVSVQVERVAAKVTCIHTATTTSTDPNASSGPYGRFVMILDNGANHPADLRGSAYADYDIPDDQRQCRNSGPSAYPWDRHDFANYNLETHVCPICDGEYDESGLGLVPTLVRYYVATDYEFQVDVANKKSYWLRHLTNKAGYSEIEQPGHTDRVNFYAKDPNFSGLAGTPNLDQQFSYLYTVSDFKTFNGGPCCTEPLPLSSYKYAKYWSWDKGTVMYIPENTMAKEDQTGDLVTRAILKITLRREQFGAEDTNTNPTNLQTLGSFFIYKGSRVYAKKYGYQNFDSNNNPYLLLRPEDVAVYATYTDNSHWGISNPYDPDALLAALAKFKSDNPTFNWDDISSNDPAISDNLSFYKNGEMYYEIPIEHFTQAEAGGIGEYGRFGVVRNNWYKLNIEEIISMGQPTIPTRSTDLLETSPGTRNSSNGQPFSVSRQTH